MKYCRALGLLLGLTVVLSAPAQAAVACKGVVTQVALTPEGDFYADFGFGSMKVCLSGSSATVYRDVNSTSPATISAMHCQTLYSAFVTAQSSGKPVSASINRADCSFAVTGENWFLNPYPYVFYFLNS